MPTEKQIEEFIAAHRLPAGFGNLIDEHYAPLAAWIMARKRPGETLLVGINGAQGTGKSTLAAFLKIALESGPGWRVAVLSIDDFYLTRAQRGGLAADVHPLLKTRGAPGTHDMKMLADYLYKLKNPDGNSTLPVPAFDKARDDRADEADWSIITGPVDLLILEGWCVGSKPQANSELETPINSLEEYDDASGEWRTYVNEQLKGPYARLFAQLDALVFLKVPSFDAVHRWRLEQEEKLAASMPKDKTGIMDSHQIARFIQHYERITRNDLAILPQSADVVLELDENHEYTGSHYKP
jgi:D-glycerate 3-kinase